MTHIASFAAFAFVWLSGASLTERFLGPLPPVRVLVSIVVTYLLAGHAADIAKALAS